LGFILSGKVLHHPKQVLRGLERNLVRKVWNQELDDHI
jgi:hypothetical protein